MSTSEIAATLDALTGHYWEQLSAWEAEFVESIARQYSLTHTLTVRQRMKLDEIFERVSRGGMDPGESRTLQSWH